MRLSAIIALALLSVPTLQAQKIGQKIENQAFLAALAQECPQCVDKKGRLTAAAAEVDSLVLNVDMRSERKKSKKADSPISFQAFSKLKELRLKSSDLITLEAWPPTLEWLVISNAEFAEPLPALPAGLKKLSLGYADKKAPAVGGFDKKRLLDTPLPQGLEELSVWAMGLETFPINLPTSLKRLSLGDNKLRSIGKIPPNISSLDVSGNQISQLNGVEWTNSLRFLDLSANPITELPQDWGNCNLQSLWLLSLPADYQQEARSLKLQLPASLLEFKLVNSHFSELSGEFPQGLRQLDLGMNGLKKIPALPAGLDYLNVRDNQLDSLRVGHSKLSNIEAKNNKLVYIDQLPSSLDHLDCSHNQLSSLPNLNNTQLTGLVCNNNQLSALAAPLPQTLKELRCWSNKLPSLPPLPAGIEYVLFYDNPISVYPEVPAGLKAIEPTFYRK